MTSPGPLRKKVLFSIFFIVGRLSTGNVFRGPRSGGSPDARHTIRSRWWRAILRVTLMSQWLNKWSPLSVCWLVDQSVWKDGKLHFLAFIGALAYEHYLSQAWLYDVLTGPPVTPGPAVVVTGAAVVPKTISSSCVFEVSLTYSLPKTFFYWISGLEYFYSIIGNCLKGQRS